MRFIKISLVLEILVLLLCATRLVAQPIHREIDKPTGPGLAVKAGLSTPISAQLAPIGTIEGPNYDTNGTNTGSVFIPPDPIGAAGPNHVVCVVNVTIQWHTKAGALQYNKSLKNFFSSLSPQTFTFDPKVIYDQYAGRFVVVTLERTTRERGVGDKTSRILLAVSDDDDPNGIWYFHEINSKIGNNWADYPGLAVDEQAVYVTCNLFSFASGSWGGQRLWIVDKTDFYAGDAAVVTVHDPWGSDAGTTQPAHIFGTAPANVGTWLVQAGWHDGVDAYLYICRVDNPVGTTTFNNYQYVNLGPVDLYFSTPMPDAPQLGSSVDIETNDRRALHAVWRNNSLWTTMQVVPPTGTDAGQATAHWVEVDTTTLATLALADQGNVGGEDIAAGTHTFFPSIAVNSAGSVGIGFSASGPNIYAGAYYTGRCTGTPAGTVQASQVLAEGVDWYVRTFSGTRNRWGDYSGMCVDPDDDTTFWAFNEYALTRAATTPGEYGRWGTRWAEFTVECQFALDFIAGFNAISCPGIPTIGDFPTLLDGLPVLVDNDGDAVALEWDPANGYGLTYNFEFKKGYFVYAYAPFQIPIGYQPLDTMTYPVEPIWNFVGSVAGSVPLGNVTYTPPGSVGDIILGWDVVNQGFFWKDKTLHPDYGLDPGSAHFMFTYTPGSEVTLDSSGSPLAQQQVQTVTESAEPTWESTITVHSRNQKQELVFGMASSASSGLDISYDIPAPPFPGDDALKAGWVVKDYGSLLLSSSFVGDSDHASWELSVDLPESGGIRWRKLPKGYRCLLMNEDEITEMNRGGNISLPAGAHRLSLVLDDLDSLPKKTVALANYPNPFNPETWIPYQLSEDTDVEIRIYNSTGQLIRTLSLGHKLTGFYTDRAKAAHWDGRNEAGEHVSSGIYFYSIKAGDLITTRKMVIAR